MRSGPGIRTRRPADGLSCLLLLAVVVAGGCDGSSRGPEGSPPPAVPVPSRSDAVVTPPCPRPHPRPRIEPIGVVELAAGQELDGAVIGGLSGLAHHGDGLFYAVSDDPGTFGPARFFRVHLDLADGGLVDGDLTIESWVRLLDAAGRPLEPRTFDLEAIALAPDETLFIASEGIVDEGVPPFLARYRRDGALLRDLDLPTHLLPGSEGRVGVRHNLALEALTLDPQGRHLFAATENALVQDGPAAAVGVPSPSRVLRRDLRRDAWAGEYVYWVDPVPYPPTEPGELAIAGLVELLALDPDHLLALERSFVAGVGNGARLYLACLRGATDVGDISDLELPPRPVTGTTPTDPDGGVTPIGKTLVLDLDELDLELDNLEGMSFGPRLPDGRRSLVLVSDDNFNRDLQVTQFIAFSFENGR